MSPISWDAGLEPSRRVKFEKELVGGYFRSLQESGVDEFSWNDCWELYRQGVFAGFAVTVVASMLVQQTERGDKMFLQWLRDTLDMLLIWGLKNF